MPPGGWLELSRKGYAGPLGVGHRLLSRDAAIVSPRWVAPSQVVHDKRDQTLRHLQCGVCVRVIKAIGGGAANV